MRKIVVGAMVSMDGVMQAPGGPSDLERARRARMKREG